MKLLGFFMVTAGFIAASLASVVDGDAVRWLWYIPALAVAYLELKPAKFRFLAPLTRVPFVRELVTGFVVCRLKRTDS